MTFSHVWTRRYFRMAYLIFRWIAFKVKFLTFTAPEPRLKKVVSSCLVEQVAIHSLLSTNLRLDHRLGPGI